MFICTIIFQKKRLVHLLKNVEKKKKETATHTIVFMFTKLDMAVAGMRTEGPVVYCKQTQFVTSLIVTMFKPVTIE